MICQEVGSASVRANLAVQRCELGRATEPLFDRSRPEQYDDPWRNEIDLPIQPVLSADGQFITAWRAIPRRPALHAVRQEDSRPRQSDSAQHPIDERAGSTNERTTFSIFGCAGCFTNEHHSCRQRPLTSYTCVRLSQSRHSLHRRIR